MILHCFPESGGCYKAALMLAVTGTPWRGVWVDYFGGGETRRAEWRGAHSVMGEVPVLEDGELVLSQSGVILHHLAERTGRFAPDGKDQAREVLRWILFDNHKFTSYFATLRFLYGFQKTGETPVTEFLRGRAKAAYHILDNHLATRDFVAADRPTIADLSLAGYVFYEEDTGLDRRAFTHVERWKDRLRALEGWKPPYDLMPPAFRA